MTRSATSALSLALWLLVANPPSSGAAVEIQQVHITQAVQDELSSVTFVAQRPIAVRVIVQANEPILAATLRVMVDGANLTPPGGVPALNLPFVAPIDPNLGQEEDTINFELLTPEIPASGDVDIIVRATAQSGAMDMQSISDLEFIHLGCVPHLFYVQMMYATPDSTFPPAPLPLVVPGVGNAFVRNAFPFPAGPFYTEFDAFSVLYSADTNSNGWLETDPDGLDLLSLLESARESYVVSDLALTRKDFLYGFFGGNPSPNNGLAAVGGNVAFGNTAPEKYQRTFAHLLGINLGLEQQPFSHTGVDGWDVGGRLIDNPTGNGVATRAKPVDRIDLMVPGEETPSAWVGPAAYEELVQEFIECEPSAVSDGALYFSGSLNALGDAIEKLEIAPPPDSEVMVELTPGDPFGTFTLRILDDLGGVQDIPFTPGAASDQPGDVSPFGFFSIAAALPPGRLLTAVSILDGQGTPLPGSLTQPTAPPSAVLVSPQTGAVLAGVSEIEWSVQDKDTPLSDLLVHVVYGWGEGNWVPVAVDLDGTVGSISIDSATLPPADGSGILRIRVSDGLRRASAEVTGLTVLSTTDVADPPADGPRQIWLSAEPNPSGGDTRVRLVLREATAGSARIVDMSGRRVRTLFLGRLPAGAHEFIWDGLDERGRRLPASVYFVRAEFEGVIGTLRLARIH